MEVKREWTDSEIYISREKRQQSHDREGGEERGRERERGSSENRQKGVIYKK